MPRRRLIVSPAIPCRPDESIQTKFEMKQVRTTHQNGNGRESDAGPDSGRSLSPRREATWEK